MQFLYFLSWQVFVRIERRVEKWTKMFLPLLSLQYILMNVRIRM